jgi:hypothetical protein
LLAWRLKGDHRRDLLTKALPGNKLRTRRAELLQLLGREDSNMKEPEAVAPSLGLVNVT